MSLTDIGIILVVLVVGSVIAAAVETFREMR